MYSSHKTGDLRNTATKLRAALRKVRYRGQISWVDVIKGDPRPLLPVLHYVALDYSSIVAKIVARTEINLAGCTDVVFVERFFRVVRQVFGYVPRLTATQFLRQSGFAEQKMMLVIDAANLCRGAHEETRRKLGHRNNCSVPSITRKGEAANPQIPVKIRISSSDASFCANKKRSKKIGKSREALKRSIPKASRRARAENKLPIQQREKKKENVYVSKRDLNSGTQELASQMSALRKEFRGLESQVSRDLSAAAIVCNRQGKGSGTDSESKDDIVATLQALMSQFDSFRSGVNSSLENMERRMRRIESAAVAAKGNHEKTTRESECERRPCSLLDEVPPLLPTAKVINRSNDLSVDDASKDSPSDASAREPPCITRDEARSAVDPLDSFVAQIASRFAESESLLE
eukprot:g1640.t1